MKQILFVLCCLYVSAIAHSWVACTDYKYGTSDDANFYNPNQCFGYPRNWQSVASGFGEDRGFNYQGAAACRDPIGSAPGYGYGTYKMAQYAPGQTVCLAWPSKNHVAATCTNAYIPDTEFEIFINPTANPSSDPAKFTNLVVNWTDHQNGQMDFKGFQACPKFCDNMDKSLCSRCFTVPNSLTVGAVYTFQWYWIFNAGTTPYTSCWEALITNTPGNTATVSGGTVASATSASATSASATSASATVTSGSTTGLPVSVTTAAAPPAGDAISFVRKPTQVPTLAGSTFDITIGYSTEGERQIVIDILDTVLPTPNWYGKGLVSNVNGKGQITVPMRIYNQLSGGQTYIFRCWIVAQGLAEAPQGWAYELDRSDSYVGAGSNLQYGDAAGSTADGESAASIVAPAVLLFVVAFMLLL